MARTIFLNEYECPRCRTKWQDEWCAMCDDDCPTCGLRHVSPHTSTETERLCDHADCIPDGEAG